MLIFSSISADYLADMLRIDRVSNPHPWQAESLREGHGQFAHLGAFIDTTLVAFVLYRQVLDEAEIIHLVCDKAQQNKGYARALLQQLCQQLSPAGVSKLFLEVRDDNAVAKKLYASLGFITVGRRVNYYGGRQDALVQQLKLSVPKPSQNYL